MAASPNDAAIRQQIYLEGVKNYEIEKGNEVAGEFIGVVLASLRSLGVTHLSELSKKAFNAFLSIVRRKLLRLATRYRGYTERWLKDVAKSDFAVTKAIFQFVAGQPVSIPTTTVGALWARIKNERVSGTGALPLAAVASYYSSVVADLIRLVEQSYSNKGTIAQLISAMKGLPSLNFRDGAASRYYRQFAALLETLIQHGSSVVNQWLGRLVSDSYIWISVLDANTTDICRGRNGHIYRYGEGPMPPAHWRCRSRTRPYLEFAPTVPQTFFAWVKDQPRKFLSDVLGAKTARSLVAGKIPPSALPKYENALRISPEQYKDKIALITM